MIVVALAAAACSNSDADECSGNINCPAIPIGESLPGRLYGAKSITTEPPCQVNLTHEVPAFLSASLPSGTSMATCPLHVHFADKPDLDSTITITYISLTCCGSGWDFSSPLFSDQTSQRDASPTEASDEVEASELGDVSQEPEAQPSECDAIDARKPHCLRGGPCSCDDQLSHDGAPVCVGGAWQCAAGYTRFEDCRGVPPGPACLEPGPSTSEAGHSDE